MKKRVLVVDDEAPVRDCLKKVLERADYEVVLAADGHEALERFAPDQIDFSILDLDLPIRSGWDVFERLTSQNPCLPVIILTGLNNRYDTAAVAGVGALMQKPFAASVLLQTMSELLAESNESRLLRLCGYRCDTRHVPRGWGRDELPGGGGCQEPIAPFSHACVSYRHWGIND